jgi:hypothetical protein
MASSSTHASYTAALRHAVGVDVFDTALGGVNSSVLPPRRCCSTLQSPPITDTAGEGWFGHMKCKECSVCAGTTAPVRRTSRSRALAVLMLGHRQRLLFDTTAKHVIGATAADGHSPTFFAYLENGTMQTTYLRQGRAILSHPYRRSDATLEPRSQLVPTSELPRVRRQAIS